MKEVFEKIKKLDQTAAKGKQAETDKADLMTEAGFAVLKERDNLSSGREAFIEILQQALDVTAKEKAERKFKNPISIVASVEIGEELLAEINAKYSRQNAAFTPLVRDENGKVNFTLGMNQLVHVRSAQPGGSAVDNLIEAISKTHLEVLFAYAQYGNALRAQNQVEAPLCVEV